jgi:hypothetical protein
MTIEQAEGTQIKRWLAAARQASLPFDGQDLTGTLGAVFFICNALIETVEIQQREIERLQKLTATPQGGQS